MIPSTTLLVAVVVLIGCWSAQSFKVPNGECKKDEDFNHPTYGTCNVLYARNTPDRLCEMDVTCYTDKMEVCPKDTKLYEYTKWEVDVVDAVDHYVCITRQQKFSSYCYTYFVCFYDQIDTNQKWWCVFSMKLNDYQQSTENTIHFKTVEIKMDNHVGNEYSFCKATTLLALTLSDGNKASVISYCDNSDPALVSAPLNKPGNDFCPAGEPTSKGCQWSVWTDVSGCQMRRNNPTSTVRCSKRRVRLQISQDRDTPPNGCKAMEVESIECTKDDVLTGCDFDCTMSEWIGQPCSPSQLPNGRLSCKRNLTRTIQINQTGNGVECGNLNKQQECKINDADLMNCLRECKLSSWSNWTECYTSTNQHGFQESQINRTQTVISQAWIPNDPRFERMMCKSFHLEEAEVCVGTTDADKLTVKSHGWMIGFSLVVVALVLVGALAILLILQRWKPILSTCRVAVSAGEDGSTAEIAGQKVNVGANKESTSM